MFIYSSNVFYVTLIHSVQDHFITRETRAA